ncbi:hypothetical protein DBR40_07180 [Pedobacter sp. KBW01]|uniref:hypothetical protein n=1 Tax=Pedobacter sp. KBW01 TaxID=2153364 RepID=UPI000F5AFC14|nr:hypothetical protein [Pedobacter sp. KBW01]RQO77750.1 hypothetical protein DBR40_07180 [Pedobacter sp. KBW01]
MITIILSLIQDQATPAAAAVPHFQTNDFITSGTLATLAGSSLGVYAVCGGLQTALNWNPRWLGLVLSILISVILAATTHSELNPLLKYVIAILNGFLIFLTATGVNAVRGTSGPPAGGGAEKQDNRVDLNQPPPPVKRTFNTRWF